MTIIASNTTTAVNTQRKTNNAKPSQPMPQQSMAATARALFRAPGHDSLQKLSHAIMDTGATSIFIMEGTPVENKRVAKKPLTINLPDGSKIKSTHCCDITIPGLPIILKGHIVPSLSIASLIGVRVLCEAGCTVTFQKDHCDIIYKGNTILKGNKDPKTDLWTIPINAMNAPPMHKTNTQQNMVQEHTAQFDTVQHTAHFSHSISTQETR
jgi:hypothetical protein